MDLHVWNQIITINEFCEKPFQSRIILTIGDDLSALYQISINQI